MNRIASLTLLTLACLNVHAAEDGMLSLSPAVVMLRGEHGQSTTQTLTLVNTTSRAFSFDLVAQDVVTRDGKRTFVEAGTIEGSIAATAIFSPAHVDIQPGQAATVNVTVTLPPGTAQRAIVALFRGTNRVMSGRVPMTASLGTLLTFAASNDVALSTAPLKVQPQTATSNLSVSQACTNSGQEPLVARGVLAIVDPRGALVGTSTIAPQRLLPGESTSMGAEYAGDLAPGRYRLLVTYDFEGQSLTGTADVEVR